MPREAWLTRGLTAKRDATKTLVTHVEVNDDATAFDADQTVTNPGGSTFRVIKTAVAADVDATTADFTLTVYGGADGPAPADGLGDGEGVIRTIALLDGTAVGDGLVRYVHGDLTIEDGDVFNVGIRNTESDANAA